MDIIKTTLLGLFFGTFGTTLGGIIGCFFRNVSNKFLSFILSFASGLMMSIICFDLIPEALGIANIIIVIIGILFGNYKKNLHGVLNACARLKEQGVDFQLVTAGDGPDMEDIRREVTEKGLAAQTHLLGFMADRAELMALYHRASLLVFPSIYDNAPMVLREAAAMGTPAVVVAGSCSAEGITDGDNGFICTDESGEAIAAAVARALPQAAQVGERARATIPVPWSRIMTRVVAEYERLIDIKRGRGA